MKETYLYREHSIELHLRGIACGRIRWTYFIDGNYCMQGATDSPVVDVARDTALALAHRAIDLLDSMRPAISDARGVKPADLHLLPAMMDHGAQRFEAVPATGS